MHHRRVSPPFSATPPVYPFHDKWRKERFLQLVREYLERGGKEVVIHEGVARVEGEPMLHGLSNLAQVCNQSPSDAWPRLVAEHLAKSDRPKMEAMVEDLAGSGYDQIASQLAIRIHPEDFLWGTLLDHIVHRRDLPGTLTVLVLDLPASALPVPVPIAESWGVPVASLFERALQNVAKCKAVRWMSLPLPPDGSVTIDALHGDFYASSHVLRTDAFLPRTGAFGNLIGLPTRGGMLSYPLDDLPTMRAIEAMLVITTGMFRDGPGSITPHLYWRTPTGQFLLQQGSNKGGKVQFAPSPEFVELMIQLRGTQPRPDGP